MSHEHRYVRILPWSWFRCADCGHEAHALACIDDQGKCECVCGLSDAMELAALARGEL